MSACRSCMKPIFWVIVRRADGGESRMPLDKKPVADGNVILTTESVETEYGETRIARVLKKGEVPDMLERRFTSHFATCRSASRHRSC